MTRTTDKYINLFTDFGFKKLFGEEPNKDLLIAFLNELLRDTEKIEDLTYLKNEQLGKNQGERRAVYDLYCSNEKGEKFIVEIQRVKQEFFKDRSVYYATFAIQEQAARGKEWQYELKGVYTIAILDFTFDNLNHDKFEHRVQLLDIQNHQVFYDKLTFIYLEIPKFNKSLSELQNDYERWLYAFKNLHHLEGMPQELEAGIFKKLLDLAEIANMNNKEQSVYQDSLKDYRDLKSAIDTYYKEGFEKGEKVGEKRGEFLYALQKY
ncbi:MAG: Rpn family recombination-promoting nuclease/putative transposase [Bacteroidota bacterium]